MSYSKTVTIALKGEKLTRAQLATELYLRPHFSAVFNKTALRNDANQLCLIRVSCHRFACLLLREQGIKQPTKSLDEHIQESNLLKQKY